MKSKLIKVSAKVPLDVEKTIRVIADRLDTTKNQVVAQLIIGGLDMFQEEVKDQAKRIRNNNE